MRLRHRTTISGIVIALALIAAACGSSSTENVEEVEQTAADNALATVSGDQESQEREADPIPARDDEALDVEQEAEHSVADSDAGEEPVEAEAPNAEDEALGDEPAQPAADSADQSDHEPDPEAESESAARFVSLGGDRPARLRLPASYDDATPLPLVMLLHGYTSNSGAQDGYFGLSEQADVDGFLLILPEGRRDSAGQQFWNATDACCDLFGAGGDDSSYLTGLIEETQQRFAVDGERVWVIGHSNGGFMSYRLACDGAPIRAIVSLAGSEFADEAVWR